MPRLDPAEIERVVLEELKTSNTPGAAVVIVAANRVLFSRGYGLANVETKAPVTPDMLFRLGSTTKMFTASTLVGLALEGKVDLNAPVGKYISGLDPAIARLTPNQLMSHTAGIKDEAPMFGSHDESALGEGIHKWTAAYLFTVPGKIYSYSNPGFWLAGYLAETIAGQPYADAVEKRVLRPLGMNRSTFRPTMAMTWPLAQGHEVRDGKQAIIRPAADNAAGWPAGSMFSSAPELARFVLAMLDGGKLDGKQVLPAELFSTMTARRASIPGSDAGYGYGLQVSRRRGVTWVQHSGSRAGYGSLIQMVPDENFGVIIVTNRTGSSLPKVAEVICDMFLDLEAAPKSADQTHALTAEEIARYAGTYANGENRLTLRSDGDALAEATMRFTKAGKDFIAGDRARVVGVAGSDGRIEFLHTGGRSYRRVN
jgi:CubicO group peptidase (beta-lactamase class C family)